MSETILGGSRWDNLVKQTYWARLSLQSSSGADEFDVDNYHDFLVEKRKNPTAASIAMHNSAKRSGFAPFYNKSSLERSPENETLVKTLDNNFHKNYPNSGRLRNVLIEHDRFSLDFVKPKMTNHFQKFLIKIKSFI